VHLGKLKNLEKLGLNGCKGITDEPIRELIKVLPNIQEVFFGNRDINHYKIKTNSTGDDFSQSQSIDARP
jgi:hypothetical protein